MEKILLLEPNISQSVSIAKYLKKYLSGYDIVGGLQPGDLTHPKNPYCQEMIPVQENAWDIFKDYALVLPSGAKSTAWCLSKISAIKCGDITFKSTNLVVFDKTRMLDMVSELGIPIPATYSRPDDIRKFPVFFKEKFEKEGGGRGIIIDQQQLEKYKNNDALLFQEYIPSTTTYGVCFIANDGVIQTFFIHKEILSEPECGGSGVILETFDNSRLLEYTKKIVSKIQYSGWGMAEFKYSQDREDYVFMEVNAKFWASIEFALMNNNAFLKYLFNIDYLPSPTQRIVYLNRMVNYPIRRIVNYLIKYRNSNVILDRTIFIRFIYSRLPQKIKNKLIQNVINYK